MPTILKNHYALYMESLTTSAISLDVNFPIFFRSLHSEKRSGSGKKHNPAVSFFCGNEPAYSASSNWIVAPRSNGGQVCSVRYATLSLTLIEWAGGLRGFYFLVVALTLQAFEFLVHTIFRWRKRDSKDERRTQLSAESIQH